MECQHYMGIRARFSWILFGIGQRVARDASTTATLQLPTNLAPTNVVEVEADGTVICTIYTYTYYIYILHVHINIYIYD